MSLQRVVVSTEIYQGRKLVARFCGPDLLAYVDAIELSGFYLDTRAAMLAGKKHVDAEIKAAADRDRESRGK